MAASSESASLPLHGIKIVEFTHMVMGPAVGAVLVELGAEVVRIEPIGGDSTRSLLGSGAGYFPMYNRNKRSICLDLKAADGLDLARRLCAAADVVVENLDEVAQMMGGLAYMTGPPGRPLRAGTSVIDVTGGMFGVIGVLAALEERHRTGRGRKVASSLFETTVYLVGQHMAQKAVTGQAAKPMPVRISAWAIYDVFETADGEQVFVGVVSDSLWEKFCAAFGLAELGADPRYKTNSQRVQARDALLPQVRELFKGYTKAALVAVLERTGLPFAPIGKPEDMFEDPHLTASGGLGATTLPDGRETRLPILPIEMDGRRPSQGGKLAKPGEHTDEVLRDLGMTPASIDELRKRRVVA